MRGCCVGPCSGMHSCPVRQAATSAWPRSLTSALSTCTGKSAQQQEHAKWLQMAALYESRVRLHGVSEEMPSQSNCQPSLSRLDMAQMQSCACRLPGPTPGAIRAGPPGFPRLVQSKLIDQAEHLHLPPPLPPLRLLQLRPLLRPLALALLPAQDTPARLPCACVQSGLQGR